MRPARFAFHEARAGMGRPHQEAKREYMQRIEKTFAGRKLVIETGRQVGREAALEALERGPRTSGRNRGVEAGRSTDPGAMIP